MLYDIPDYNAPDLWNELQTTFLPIVMYGMGNGADRILKVCESRNIEVRDFFASDGFVRGHTFHGKRVLSFAEIRQKYERFIVLLAFGSSLSSVISNIQAISMLDCCTLYAPDIPVSGGELFDRDFYQRNYDNITEVYASLADNLSRKIYSDVLRYKLSGDISYLTKTFNMPENNCHPIYTDILNPEKYRVGVDLGAYNGDTARLLIASAPNLETLYAFEPDAHNFKKLSEFAATSDAAKILAYNIGAWSEHDRLAFKSEGNRNSALSEGAGKLRYIDVDSLDNILDGRPVDYIKFDVEGAEAEALKGCSKTIISYFPNLCISIYHKSEDIFAIPKAVMALNGNYRLYIRKPPYIPAWDLSLICIDDRHK